MASRIDILQDSTGDLRIDNGDFVVGESDKTHIQDTLIAQPGWWKQYPQDGVGILLYDRSSGQEQVLARSIKIELEKDGFTVDNPLVEFINDKLTVNPNASI